VCTCANCVCIIDSAGLLVVCYPSNNCSLPLRRPWHSAASCRTNQSKFVDCFAWPRGTRCWPTTSCHAAPWIRRWFHPREIFKVALLANARAVIVGHNHPSGDPTPSADDIQVTQRIKSAGAIVGIELFDHIVIAGDRYVSFQERGLI
jgi:proteasome lid subunit RPN8/RPN11